MELGECTARLVVSRRLEERGGECVWVNESRLGTTSLDAFERQKSYGEVRETCGGVASALVHQHRMVPAARAAS